MKILKTLSISAVLALPVSAQTTENFSFSPHLGIPDGNATGVSDVETISSAGTSISSIKVTLDISGDFNGDLYLYLRHDAGMSILLNRPGVTSGNSFGYADHGFNVTFRDDAAHDIHNYRDFSIPGMGLPLTGEWQPDARNGDPISASRSIFLSSFQGLNPNGQWTLFAADLSNNGTSQIQNWAMEMTLVPEPQNMALVVGGALVGFSIWRRARKHCEVDRARAS